VQGNNINKSTQSNEGNSEAGKKKQHQLGFSHADDGPRKSTHKGWPEAHSLATKNAFGYRTSYPQYHRRTGPAQPYLPTRGGIGCGIQGIEFRMCIWLNGEPPALSITGNCDDCTYSRDTVTGNLHEICLPQRGIASIVNGTFDGMPSMMKLRLGWNEIIEFYSGTFSHNLSLLDLDHRDTQIAKHHFDTFHHNAALEQIRLSFNPTTKLHSDIFKHKDEI